MKILIPIILFCYSFINHKRENKNFLITHSNKQAKIVLRKDTATFKVGYRFIHKKK